MTRIPWLDFLRGACCAFLSELLTHGSMLLRMHCILKGRRLVQFVGESLRLETCIALNVCWQSYLLMH